MRISSTLCVIFAILLASASAWAESWCASPIFVHEWGVHTFGQCSTELGEQAKCPIDTKLPSYFHREGPAVNDVSRHVKDEPVDTGEREIPVIQVYSKGGWSDRIPLAVELGFANGQAQVWYPQVDARLANDEPIELVWSQLSGSETPLKPAPDTELDWILGLRKVPDALWLNHKDETERFIFYEGDSQESAALRLRKGEQYSPEKRHLLIENTSDADVEDVFLSFRGDGHSFLFFAPKIPAKSSAGFILEEHELSNDDWAKSSRSQLRKRLLEPLALDAIDPWTNCIMGRDPAQPYSISSGYRLYSEELEVLLALWAERFFDSQGYTLLYRESTAYVDQQVPLRVYTDMYYYVVLSRLSLALMENVLISEQ
ncbi:MAG: hypothetical protein RBU37_15975 [Myxococcota bacterium]|jgi:hypothetical protein|nr:hypothetical protein [Myxococcota bacterium]